MFDLLSLHNMWKRSQGFGCSSSDWLNKWLRAELPATKHMTDVLFHLHTQTSRRLCVNTYSSSADMLSTRSLLRTLLNYYWVNTPANLKCHLVVASEWTQAAPSGRFKILFHSVTLQLNIIITITHRGLVTHTQRLLTCQKLMEVLFFLSKHCLDTVSLLNVSCASLW